MTCASWLSFLPADIWARSVLTYNQWSDQIVAHSITVSIIHWKRLCPWFFHYYFILFQFLKLRFPRRLTPSRWLLRDTIIELPREVDQKKTTIERDKYDTPGHSFYSYWLFFMVSSFSLLYIWSWKDRNVLMLFFYTQKMMLEFASISYLTLFMTFWRA